MDLRQSPSLFKNPTKCLHTLLDWFKIDHEGRDIDNIEQICSFDPDDTMVKTCGIFVDSRDLLSLSAKSHSENCSVAQTWNQIQSSS